MYRMDTIRFSSLKPGLVLILLALAIVSTSVEAATRRPADILPGHGIRNVAKLGWSVDRTVKKLERKAGGKLKNIKRVKYKRGGKVATGLGISLVHNTNNYVQRIIITDPNLFTNKKNHVYSSLEDILLEYGKSYKSLSIKSGYMLVYKKRGIAFDFDRKTNRVRAIVLFSKR